MMRFPSSFPEDCPPDDAEDAGGAVFRLVKSQPPEEADFATHLELGKMPHAPACLRAGLSVFRSREDAVHQHELLPFLGSFVASGNLGANDGKTKLTQGRQPTHTTWWPYQGTDRSAPFTNVERLA